MLPTAPLEWPAGVGGVHVTQDVGQGYEGDQEGEEKEIIKQGGSPGSLDGGRRNKMLVQQIFLLRRAF